MLSVTVGIIFVSNSAIKIPARTGPKGESMATLSFCWYISPPKQKWTFLVDSNNKLRLSFLLIDVSISLRWYILSKATLILSSRGTVVNSDITSNGIILNLWGTFTSCIFLYEIFCTLDCVLRLTQRDESFAKYFASW